MGGQLVENLREIGLNEYQSRAYIASVGLGAARLSTLAEKAEIPQQRIYDVVDDLEGLGLVEVRKGSNAKEAVPVPPTVALAELKARHLDDFNSHLDAATDELNDLFDEVDSGTGSISFISQETSIRRHIGRAIESAEWWLFVSLPVSWYPEFEPEIRAAADRGVTVRLLLVGDDEDAIHRRDYPDSVAVNWRPGADTLVAADRNYGVFRAIAAPSISRPALVTDDKNILEMFHRYSEQFWLAANPVRAAETPPLRYLNPCQLVQHHADLLDSTSDLAVTVKGHATTTGRAGTWQGTLRDYVCEPPISANSGFIPQVVSLELSTAEGPVTVGGWDATLEDVAAHGIELSFSE
ncbi:TrmB family transcriptional regulator [Haloarcula marina]|uniref:TrmB family transcriptional regulator n=1 Tax=Haloarcula marina TaxID=2961574 RepID=UPI0020B8865C|nr:TrmB family transcriptional regulator sugar-binding domain-containing protein [Halomicroarcula marina]